MNIKDITNVRLLEELHLSKIQYDVTKELAEMLLAICEHIANNPLFVHRTYRDPMIYYAWQCSCAASNKFEIMKSDNPFSYFNTLIPICFNQYITTKECLSNIFWIL